MIECCCSICVSACIKKALNESAFLKKKNFGQKKTFLLSEMMDHLLIMMMINDDSESQTFVLNFFLDNSMNLKHFFFTLRSSVHQKKNKQNTEINIKRKQKKRSISNTHTHTHILHLIIINDSNSMNNKKKTK